MSHGQSHVDYIITQDLLPGDVHVSCYEPLDNFHQAHVASICQRAENPSIIDVTVNIFGSSPEIALVPELTLFSVGGTEEYINSYGLHLGGMPELSTTLTNGDYYQLNPLSTDPGFSGFGFFSLNGSTTFAFSADMSDHLSSWSAEEKVYIHTTFATPTADLSAFSITWPPP